MPHLLAALMTSDVDAVVGFEVVGLTGAVVGIVVVGFDEGVDVGIRVVGIENVGGVTGLVVGIAVVGIGVIGLMRG
jgi:hypothetical protein